MNSPKMKCFTTFIPVTSFPTRLVSGFIIFVFYLLVLIISNLGSGIDNKKDFYYLWVGGSRPKMIRTSAEKLSLK